MKQTFPLIAVLLSMTLLVFTGEGQADRSLVGQEKTEQRKNEEQDKAKPSEKISGELGAKTNPVRCDSPRGEREYLNRLRCPDEKRPQYERIGSYGLGPYGNILDGYRVKCEEKDSATVFMDMYHKDYIEREPVPGFTIINEEPPPARFLQQTLLSAGVATTQRTNRDRQSERR